MALEEAAAGGAQSPAIDALACASHTFCMAVFALLFATIPLACYLPVHLASLAVQLWNNPAFCSKPFLASHEAGRLFERLQGALQPLQLLVPAPLLLPNLAHPARTCCAGLSWIQVVFGFVLPTYLRVRWDLQGLLLRAQQEGRAPPSPRQDWGSWVRCVCYRTQCQVEATWSSRLLACLALAGFTWTLCSLAFA